MRFKNAFWLILCAAVLLVILFSTNAQLHKIDALFTIFSFMAFFISTVFWALAWAFFMQKPAQQMIKINTKSLIGLFSPFGLGADALRAFFARKEKISAIAALSSSFLIKFFKFLIMFALLVLAVLLLPKTGEYYIFFTSMIFLTLFGAAFVFALRFKPVNSLFYRAIRREFVPRFRAQLNRDFSALCANNVSAILFFLLVSSLFEIVAVQLAFFAAGAPLSFLQAFIFSTVAYSLALVTVSPQGVGFVEGGGFILLSFPYFGLNSAAIGTFLIVLSIIRIWLPSLVGVLVIWRCSR